MLRIFCMLLYRNSGSWIRLLRFCDERWVPWPPRSTPASDRILFSSPVTDDAHPRPPTPGHDDGPGGPPRPHPRHVWTIDGTVPDVSWPVHWTPCAWYTREVVGCYSGWQAAAPAGQTVQEYAASPVDAIKCFCKVDEFPLITEQIARSLWTILFFCPSSLSLSVCLSVCLSVSLSLSLSLSLSVNSC